MPTTPNVTARAAGALLTDLSNAELGERFAEAVAATWLPGKRRGRGGSLDWLRDPELRRVLNEFRRRGERTAVERHGYLELCSLELPPAA